MINIIEIKGQENRSVYNTQLIEFEKKFSYPFGEDRFRLDHGNNYYAFFDRIGQPHVFCVLDEGLIVAVCIAVLREVPIASKKQLAWYLCDLKIDDKYKGTRLVQKLCAYALPKYWHICDKIYGVSMNDKAYKGNRVANFASKIRGLGLKEKASLAFYMLDAEDKKLRNYLMRLQPHFVSNSGIKDLLMAKTKQHLSLRHYQKNYAANPEPIKKGVNYMLCYSGDEMIPEEISKTAPAATATVIANFQPDTWSFISSAEI